MEKTTAVTQRMFVIDAADLRDVVREVNFSDADRELRERIEQAGCAPAGCVVASLVSPTQEADPYPREETWSYALDYS